MSKEKKINIDKNRFKTPEGYFENISLNNLVFSNKNNFKTPLNYWNDDRAIIGEVDRI